MALSAFAPYGAANADDESQRLDDVSARVVYEDPAQLQERQRLMSLLKTTSKSSISDAAESIETTLSVSSVSASARVTRRSVRLSGNF